MTQTAHTDQIAKTCDTIEKTLSKSQAFRKVEERLYVVHQGSTYVTISVVDAGREGRSKPVVRVYAQVVSGVRPEPSLFRQLLVLNARMRFGAFAFVPEGDVVLFVHTILGGDHMDAQELVATVTDVALVADGYDDRIVARYGGQRMQDVVEDVAMQHLLGEEDEDILGDEPPAAEPNHKP
jgi:hypothetical protein